MNAITKTFRSGNSVAVRLPKDMGIEAGVEVELSRVGRNVLIEPKSKYTGADLVRALRAIGPPPDGVQKREKIIFPKRPGL